MASLVGRSSVLAFGVMHLAHISGIISYILAFSYGYLVNFCAGLSEVLFTDSSVFVETESFGRIEILVCLRQFSWGLGTDSVSSPM